MEENNKKDKKTIIAIVVLVVICLLVVAPVAWFAGKQVANKESSNETKEKQDNKKEEKQEKPEEPKKEEKEVLKEETITIEKTPETKEYTIQKVAYEQKDPEGNVMMKVELTTTGEALLSYYGDEENKLENIKIAEDVVLVQGVHVGMSDICAGNARVIFIHKNTSISSLNVDQLECGDSIEVTKNVDGLTDIVEIKEITNHSGSPYEPNNYTVYAVDSKGEEYNLNEALS